VDYLLDGLRQAFELILGGDSTLVETTLHTLRVGLESTLIAALFGLPAGVALGLGRFRGRGLLLGTFNAGIRMPPVALGMVVWLLLWPDSRWGGGPLSGLGWIDSLPAVILVQTLLVLPIVAALTAAAVQRVPEGLLDQARAYGARRTQLGLLALREARVGVLAALTAALGTAIASVGAILVVGPSLTRTTLATGALGNWRSGDYSRAVAYGTVLLGMFLILAAVMTTLQHRRSAWIPGRAS
jgi:tungstate transport system permease protein